MFNYDVEERTKGIVQEVAKYRAQNHIERPDFLHQLQQVGAKDASFTINDVAVGIAAIIMDGYDTSANVFSYLAYEVARHQDIQNRLREEIEETLYANDNELTYDTMQEMKLLEASILGTWALKFARHNVKKYLVSKLYEGYNIVKKIKLMYRKKWQQLHFFNIFYLE